MSIFDCIILAFPAFILLVAAISITLSGYEKLSDWLYCKKHPEYMIDRQSAEEWYERNLYVMKRREAVEWRTLPPRKCKYKRNK